MTVNLAVHLPAIVIGVVSFVIYLQFVTPVFPQLQVRILCPDESDSDKLNGQVLEVEVATLGSTIGELKSRLAEELGLAANKQQFSR